MCVYIHTRTTAKRILLGYYWCGIYLHMYITSLRYVYIYLVLVLHNVECKSNAYRLLVLVLHII